METEQKLHNEANEETDNGYSEQHLAIGLNRGRSSTQTQTIKTVKVFAQPKSSHTIFQAPKDEEI